MAGLDAHGNPVCQSLDTLDDVMKWNTHRVGLHNNLRQVFHDRNRCLKSKRGVERRPEVLVCHDMEGGYLEDRFLQGCDNSEAYRFYHWHLIDTFVYFSHRFITIPPASWIQAAHKNDVQILGTLITEWEDGSKLCRELLKSKDNIDLVARKLADIAVAYDFDGWLINIENSIEEKSIPDLQYFVERVTFHCHIRLQGTAKVLWYDSVTRAGALDWQNELNDKNQLFFTVCDGIFLNYTITEENLAQSRQVAQATDRCFDVYVGVDVFGRAPPGWGGFDCNKVLELISKHGLSCAIFAQGWVYEELGPDNFDSNELKFWKLLKDFLPRRAHTVPVNTSFCQGFGQKHYVEGKVVSEKPWHNLSLQQLQPCYGDCDGASLVTSDAYNGGGCLKLDCSPTGTSVVRLLRLDLEKRAQPLTVTATWKECCGFSPRGLSFVLLARDDDNDISDESQSSHTTILTQESCLDRDNHAEAWNHHYVNESKFGGTADSGKKPLPRLHFAEANTVERNEDSGWITSAWDISADWLFTNQHADHHRDVLLYALLLSTPNKVNPSTSQETPDVQSPQIDSNAVLLGNLQIRWKQSSQQTGIAQRNIVRNMTCLEVNTFEPVTTETFSTTLQNEVEDLRMAARDPNKAVIRDGKALALSSGESEGRECDDKVSKQVCLFKRCQAINSEATDGTNVEPLTLHFLQWALSTDFDIDYYTVFTMDKCGSEQCIGFTCTNSFVARVENSTNVIGYFIKPVMRNQFLHGQKFYFSVL